MRDRSIGWPSWIPRCCWWVTANRWPPAARSRSGLRWTHRDERRSPMTSERVHLTRRTLLKGVGLAAAAGALAACTTGDDPSVVGGGVFRGLVREYWLQLENRPWDAAPWN